MQDDGGRVVILPHYRLIRELTENPNLTFCNLRKKIRFKKEKEKNKNKNKNKRENMELCARNDTSPECVGAQTDALQSGAANGSLETSNSSYSNMSTVLIPQHVRQKGERAQR